MAYKNTIAVVDMCGSEGAQVVAAHLPALLRRSAPEISLCSAVASRLQTFDHSAGSYIVLLPAEAGRARAAWRRFKELAAPSVAAPVLPVVVGDVTAGQHLFGSRTSAGSAERLLFAKDGTESPEPRSPAAGLRALPVLHISGYDARIEHGGRFHLDREVAKSLDSRLAELKALLRRLSLWQHSFLAPAASGCAWPAASLAREIVS